MVTTTAAGIIAFWIFEVKTDGQRRLARPFSQPTHNTLLRPAVAHNLQKYDTIAHGECSRQRRQMAPKFKLYRVRFQNISCQYWLFKIFFMDTTPLVIITHIIVISPMNFITFTASKRDYPGSSLLQVIQKHNPLNQV